MPSVSATRRASSTAPRAQQASSRWISGMLGRSGQTLSVTPTTSCPACLSSAAVTELSTPPDMPTMTFDIGLILSEIDFGNLACFGHRVGLGDAPGADGWMALVAEADQDVERGQVCRQPNVSRRRA